MDRRSFLLALGTAFLPGPGRAASPEHVYVSACQSGDGAASVAAFDPEGRLLFASRLPERGHDVAARPGSDELVVFARRPGNWAAIVDRTNGRVGQIVTAPPGRHFYGHGTFTADGALLWATENAIASGEGVLGLYDARAGYARLGEIPSDGIGPHDLAWRPAGAGGGLVVANGGIRTHPETGREILNPSHMEPSLAILDPRTGATLLKSELGPDLRGLSVRHLAVAPDGRTIFGCQYEGDPAALPSLVGILETDGRTRFLDLPEDDLAALDNYVGSVRLDASGRRLAATSPRGNAVVFWDLDTGAFLGRRRMADVCGVAPGGRDGTFVVTSGNAGIRMADAGRSDLARLGGTALDGWIWDNHLVRV